MKIIVSQDLEPDNILKIFLNFTNSYKIYSYKKREQTDLPDPNNYLIEKFANKPRIWVNSLHIGKKTENQFLRYIFNRTKLDEMKNALFLGQSLFIF